MTNLYFITILNKCIKREWGSVGSETMSFHWKKIYSRDKKSEERKKENDAEEAKKKELMVKNNRKTKIREK